VLKDQQPSCDLFWGICETAIKQLLQHHEQIECHAVDAIVTRIG
jgi:hypothetical protein